MYLFIWRLVIYFLFGINLLLNSLSTFFIWNKLFRRLTPRIFVVYRRTDSAWFYRSFPFLFDTTFTYHFIIILLHLFYDIFAIRLKSIYLFVSKKFELLWIFREIKFFHQFDPHSIETSARKVKCSPDIYTLMNHSKKSTRKFDKIGNLFICYIFIKIINEVTASPLNASHMRTILCYLYHLRQQRSLNWLNYAPTIRLHCLLQKL